MQRWIAVGLGWLVLAGCAGLDIRPLTPGQAARAHAGEGPAGYIVYAPLTVIEVSDREGCRAGAPFQLPDYSRPYLVRSRTGVGRNGVDVAISAGWMLGGIRDTSDNGVLLDAMGTALGVRAGSGGAIGGGGLPAGACRAPGLYRLAADAAGNVQLLPLHLY